MANVYAVKSGNWSDTTVWNTGALPTSADDVWSNNFTVTIDISPTVLSIRNGASSPIVAGGQFTPSNGISLTLTGANGIIPGTGAGTVFVSNLTTGQSCTVTGSIIIITTNNNGQGLLNQSSGTVNIIGNCTSLGAVNFFAVQNSSSGVVNITGNCTGGAAGTAGNASGVVNSGPGTINVTGSVSGGSGNSCFGLRNTGVGTINLIGTLNGGSTGGGSGSYGADNGSTGTFNITGTIQASSQLPGLGPGGLSQNTFITGPLISSAQGIVPSVAFRWRWVASVGSSYMTVPNSTATGYKNLFTVDAAGSGSGQPAVTNVRSGTVYGPASELTGTCAVPAAASVAFGVPVDNTTGTATLTAADVQAALTSQGLTTTRAGYLDRLPNTSTTQEVADIIDAAI